MQTSHFGIRRNAHNAILKDLTPSPHDPVTLNDLMVTTEAGKNYFVRQYIKMGVFVGGAGVELVDEAVGKEAVAGLSMAKQGVCSQ